MGFLNKIFGSDQDLKKPDFSSAPLVNVDFSGNKISFRDPPQTAMFPINNFPHDMDISNSELYSKQDSGDFAKEFYVKGWNLFGLKSKAKGSVIISAIMKYYPPDTINSLNLFEKSTFENAVLLFCHNKWGWQNESENLGDPGDGTYTYPIDNTSLKYMKKNNITWCHFTSQIKGKPPSDVYACPITDSHVIILDFTLSTYQGLDFYSPKTNIEQASFQIIDEFMDNFNIELSESSKQQQSAAKESL